MSQQTDICPCCGGEMRIKQGVQYRMESHTLISSTYAVVFPKREAQIFWLLWRGRNNGHLISRYAIFDHLYGDDPNGGPDDIKIIEVFISRIRNRLKQCGAGIEIKNRYNEGYFLRECAAA